MLERRRRSRKKVITEYSKDRLLMSDDAARANWGGKWRMPTRKETEELITGCTWEFKEEGEYAKGSLPGYLVTSKKNGRTIFLPCAGYRYGTFCTNANKCDFYWTSEPAFFKENAYLMDLNGYITQVIKTGIGGGCGGYRCTGCQVRAVCE